MVFFKKNRKIRDSAHQLFGKVVAAARAPHFYRDWSVADSLDGRFDLIILHLAMDEKNEKEIRLLIRTCQEVLFDNMDMSLREMGVGDMSVGKKVKAMAEAWYGRKAAYQAIFQGLPDTGPALKEALVRNIYRTVAPDEAVLDRFVVYITTRMAGLATRTAADFMAAGPIFEKNGQEI